MNILVCAKQVPDTAEIKIDWENHTLIRDNVSCVLNPYDGYALEAAAKIKDRNPDTTITVISMGPVRAEEMLRECLAIAADQAYLITDKAFGGSDTYATSYVLAQAIQHIQKKRGMIFDAIFCGKQAIDGDTAQVGPELAEHLGYPQVTSCLKAEEREKEFIVLQERDNNKKVIGVTYPCVVTFTKPDTDPRFPTFKRKLAARKAAIPHISSTDIKGIDLRYAGIKGSPTKERKTYVQATKTKGVMIESENIEKIIQELCNAVSKICEIRR